MIKLDEKSETAITENKELKSAQDRKKETYLSIETRFLGIKELKYEKALVELYCIQSVIIENEGLNQLKTNKKHNFLLIGTSKGFLGIKDLIQKDTLTKLNKKFKTASKEKMKLKSVQKIKKNSVY